MNRILDKFARGETPVGTFTHLKSTVAIEAMGHTGLDYVVADTEHCPAGIEFVSAAVTAAAAAGVDVLVRINDISRSAVLQPLDLGADGLIVPNVETVEEVRRLVRFAKFPPLGGRGFCPTRDGGWGYAPHAAQGADAYMAAANRQTLLLPQCETAGCLSNIEEIAAIDGVDGIFVGPLDLSIALGCPMELDDPKMLHALERVRSACRSAGKKAFIFCGGAQAARDNLSAGFDSVAVGLDALVLIQSYRALLAGIRA